MRLAFHNAAIEPLWRDLNLEVAPGEFLAILGSNGVGKSTLFQTVLGQRTLTRGSVEVEGTIGYIPQQRMFPANLPIRARDLVGLSTAHGVFRNRRPRREQIDAALAEVGAAGLADRRVGKMSGGQQQLIRQAQALAGDPEILLCDEPLLSMDLRAQRATVELLERQRRKKNAAVLFITHNINPILEVTDRVLYITPHGHRQGTVAEVMNTETLSELYQTEVKVIEVDGKLIVL
ncbi:metal ABC transporter ATP-binding protein [Corynebacterium urealyticum]|uniref:Putative ABC transport system, ATP-binding protein n=1 Tax=Corynebacterium urealyticum (strain ATCC 43042 / DSM 7109) TaxID=504474 RepID=B1VIN9_CORU7|nr:MULTISPECIES: metal ABC transporter ATP-binding protein [Corynebacterium]MDK7135151.1 metal ABC transporter ATP-binding protein [Corynebacterium sp. UMB4614]QQC42789.1 metal ABC transporter ATP-binding protein [Corynebacterium urealyticum]QQE51403.1 metal ABC transporter ATP-binding protein [Corynebacterium urealyticum]CAQ05623.1 putative ABC transport system, ATP-binding protein [Corynebacterium urealyticum DSM 7109]SNV90082.1 ABC transporter ATP-binding protein [Corynebacterium urealyticu